MSRSKVPAWACALLVMILPLALLSSGCSFLPGREKLRETATNARDVTEEALKARWESTWKPALREEAKSAAMDLAGGVRDMLKSQAATYAADLEAKVASGKASAAERWAYWILGALGLLGTGKGVSQGGKLKAMLTAVVTAVETAGKSGAPVDLKALIKAEATKLGVDALLYPLVQAISAKIKPA